MRSFYINEIGSDMHKLEPVIGYKFANLGLLKQALTHSSYTNEMGVPNHHLLSNERMEFLGDSVLSFVTSEYLYETYKDLPEGNLTKMRSAVVCGESLSSFARQIKLGDYLFLGAGEQSGRDNPSVLENAFEALIAAIFLDAGGGEEAKEEVSDFVLPFIKRALAELSRFGFSRDYKSLLQQVTQESEHVLPVYELIGDTEVPGNDRYTVRVLLNNNVLGTGKGPKRQKAEVAAAKEALTLLGLIKTPGES